jgi:hypothetical protein
MRWKKVAGGYAVVFERGDEVLEGLRQLARETGLRSGCFTGLGAVDHVQLAFWDPDRREYLKQDLYGDHEVGNLTGNLTILNGEPFVHAHGVVAGRDFVAKAGHVMTARVSATLEVHVRDFEAEIQRGMVPEIGLNLWQL